MSTTYLLDTERGVACSNAFFLFLCERVEHAVMRVDGGQAVLGQLVVDHLHYFLHPVLVVCPITRNLRIN